MHVQCMSSLIGIRKYIVGLVIKLSSDPQTMQVHMYMYDVHFISVSEHVRLPHSELSWFGDLLRIH